MVIFPPVMPLVLDDPKQITDQIHELILEDHWAGFWLNQ